MAGSLFASRDAVLFEQTKKSLRIDRKAAKSASLLPPGSCILTDSPTHFF
jgi:hypothetical protein